MLSTRPDKSNFFLYLLAVWPECSHVVCCGTIRFSWSLFGDLFLWKATKAQRKTTSSQSHQLIQTRVNKVCRCENALKEADSLHFNESGERNTPDYFLLGDYFCVFPFVFFFINRPSLNLTLLCLYFAFCMFSRLLFLSVNLYVFDA